MTKKVALDNQALVEQDTGLIKQVSRRNFLRYAGLSSGLVLLGTACSKDDDNNNTDQGVNLGSGDVGILNYAYALEQLEAAFYVRVVSSFPSTMNAEERALLTDIRDHEVSHRELFKAALAGNAIQALEVNFDSIDFGNRDKVMEVARTFEDLGVSAYNGAGQYLTNVDFLLLAGKIVSVEARHAALIRDRISNGSFVAGDVVDLSTGLEKSKSPTEVLTAASAFIKTKINASNLPS